MVSAPENVHYKRKILRRSSLNKKKSGEKWNGNPYPGLAVLARLAATACMVSGPAACVKDRKPADIRHAAPGRKPPQGLAAVVTVYAASVQSVGEGQPGVSVGFPTWESPSFSACNHPTSGTKRVIFALSVD